MRKEVTPLKNIAKKLKFAKFPFKKDTLFGGKTHAIDLKPGMVLKTKNGTLLLVGDVNRLMGVCDDCKDFDWDDIVEYADIYSTLM